MAQRQHYIPRFHLRRFSNAAEQLRVHVVGEHRAYVNNIRKLGAKVDFYTFELPGADPNAVEHILQMVEGPASDAISRILRGQFPAPARDRVAIAQMLGFQALRTPESRLVHEKSFDRIRKLALEGMDRDAFRKATEELALGWDDEELDKMFELIVVEQDDYIIRPDKSSHLYAMLDTGVRAARWIHERSWSLGHTAGDHFVTSDHPLVGFTPDSDNSCLIGLGLENAAHLMFPLSTNHLLLMSQPALRGPLTFELDNHAVEIFNGIIAAAAYEFVFQNPADRPIDDLIPDEKRDVAPLDAIDASVRPYLPKPLWWEKFKANEEGASQERPSS